MSASASPNERARNSFHDDVHVAPTVGLHRGGASWPRERSFRIKRFTATIKGSPRLHPQWGESLQPAGDMGANAVLGLTTSSFGAGSGITSVFGGDVLVFSSWVQRWSFNAPMTRSLWKT